MGLPANRPRNNTLDSCSKGLTGDNLRISRGMSEITSFDDSDFWLRWPKFGYFISRQPLKRTGVASAGLLDRSCRCLSRSLLPISDATTGPVAL